MGNASKWKKYQALKARLKSEILAKNENISIDEAIKKTIQKRKHSAPQKSRHKKRTEKINARKLRKEKKEHEKNKIITCKYCHLQLIQKNHKKHLKKAHPKEYEKIKSKRMKKYQKYFSYIQIVSGGGGPGTGKKR